MSRKGFAPIIILLVVVGVLVVGGVIYYAAHRAPISQKGSEITFSGTIQAVSDESSYDGSLSIEVDNKWIVIGGGLRPEGSESGSVIGLDSAHWEKNIGKTVEVFATEVDPQNPNNLTILGANKYYVKAIGSAPQNLIAATSSSINNKALFNFEDVAIPYIMNGETTGTIQISFKVVRLNPASSTGNPAALSTQGIDFMRDGLAEIVVDGKQCPATVVSSIEGETMVTTSSVRDKWEAGDQWTIYTVKLQPSCPLNMGNSFLQFHTSGAATDYHLGTIGITVYVSPTVPKPRVVILKDPAATVVNVTRGDNLNLDWYTSGGEASDTIKFYLYSTSTGYSDDKIVSLDQGSLAFPIVVPAGTYLLTGNYEYVGGYTTTGIYYGTLPFQTEAQISRVLTVMVASSSVQ